MTDELRAKLVRTAEYIIETSARETTSGSYITYANDIPEDILSAELFLTHIEDIAEIMWEYDSVADIEVDAKNNECIDAVMYLAYCPNFEPHLEEEDEYPPDREILNPLEKTNHNSIVQIDADKKMTDELRAKLVRTAEYIIEKSATETTSGNHVTYAHDIPADILSRELFWEHIEDIAEIMREYESVIDVDVSPYYSMDVGLYLDYCPNFEPEPDEDISPVTEFLDPLKRKDDIVHEDICTARPTLAERLEEGKRKAAQHEPQGKPKPKDLEV